MKKKVTSVICFILAINISVAIVISVFSSIALAKPMPSSITLEENYKLWRSYTVINNCLKDFGAYNKKTVNTTSEADALYSLFYGHEVVGDLYAKLVGATDAGVSCENKKEDINAVFAVLGMKDVFEFKKKLDNLMDQKNQASLSKKEITEYLQSLVTNKGGKLDLFAQPSFQYWYWREIYYNGDCQGMLSNEPKGDFINSTDGAPYFFVYDDKPDKGVVKFDHANFKIGLENEVKNLDRLRKPEGDKAPGCATIASYLTKDRAEAYLKELKKNPDNAKTAPKSAGGNGAGGEKDKKESCEERMKLSAGWIVCSGLQLLSDGMETLMDYIDDLLNVDVVKLNTLDDGGLHSSWSYFRAVATFLLVAVGLVMIISQAIGGGSS